MGNKLLTSITASTLLTFLFFIIKLFNFNEWSELITPLYIGIVWFFFILIVLTILEKQFPNQAKNFKSNLFDIKNKSFGKAKDSMGMGSNLDEIKDKVDLGTKSDKKFANMSPASMREAKEAKEFEAKEARKNTAQKNKKGGELGAEDFDFETEKIANAVRTMINKE